MSQLTIVGDSCELKDFSAKCRCNTEILLTLTLPDLKMCLPSKEFYELLYNRYGLTASVPNY